MNFLFSIMTINIIYYNSCIIMSHLKKNKSNNGILILSDKFSNKTKWYETNITDTNSFDYYDTKRIEVFKKDMSITQINLDCDTYIVTNVPPSENDNNLHVCYGQSDFIRNNKDLEGIVSMRYNSEKFIEKLCEYFPNLQQIKISRFDLDNNYKSNINSICIHVYDYKQDPYVIVWIKIFLCLLLIISLTFLPFRILL